jgi:hypothetical protein
MYNTEGCVCWQTSPKCEYSWNWIDQEKFWIKKNLFEYNSNLVSMDLRLDIWIA